MGAYRFLLYCLLDAFLLWPTPLRRSQCRVLRRRRQARHWRCRAAGVRHKDYTAALHSMDPWPHPSAWRWTLF